MHKLHYFNPANDLALAANVANYTPPQAALQLQKAGELLPLWFGDFGDKVLCYGVNAKWLEKICSDFGIGVMPYNHSDILSPSPWGWSLASRRLFALEGLPENLLPTTQQIETMRQLSHRRTSTLLATELQKQLPNIDFACPPASETDDPIQAENIIDQLEDAILKAPWSSTGRGVISTKEIGRERALRFAADSIRRQGSVMIETCFDKSLDFAKIFECADGECRPLGTSVFLTDTHGSYTGNLLASEEERLKRVSQFCSLSDLDAITQALCRIIQEKIAPDYTGILGIDMLADKNGRIDPVVELNLRKTMGYVANTIADRYMPDGAFGTYAVTPLKGMPQPANYECANGKLIAGTIMLVPPNPHFAFTATICD